MLQKRNDASEVIGSDDRWVTRCNVLILLVELNLVGDTRIEVEVDGWLLQNGSLDFLFFLC